MSSKEAVLSSEKALDDYFSALLAEEQELELFHEDDLVAERLVNSYQPELRVQYSEPESYRYAETDLREFEAPNLEDVERLLSQLESTNVVDELGIDDILAQNTATIAELQQEAQLVVEREVLVDEVPVVEVKEEIQDWPVETEFSEEIQDWPVEIEEPAVDVAPVEPELETISQEEEQVSHETQVELEMQTESNSAQVWSSTQRTDAFQVLYFDVNSVTFAVPLDELGGIHQLTQLNHLIGRPGWYLGLQTNRDQQLDVVDTARWVMPDKLADEEYKSNYQYIVMLGNSMWGLASNKLLGTELLYPEKVRWREQSGKRPWLAGMVKEKMCALIHVDALISMLNAGLDVKSLNSEF
ncbi:chemotaxis protein CheW [Vibrio sp. IRLE0018]|uniref:chemotaxis protein CheW n=1 Tax=Vibrio TaxID=662 RepID=UPI0015941BB7|nr:MULTISPECIES: chemotaxis protein CheW [Vibrio]MCF8779585.1 chemotaxis protein CheW [Vibrio floridensis]NVC63807.1 chemotaxis protein CheW [Vibrio sp. 05-20-BW147]HAS6349861.1 chemotaxis protein CheW [Vibrio vulnificus]